MPAQKHAELEICDFNAKTREFTLYDRRKTKALLSLLVSDQIRLKQTCVYKIREICEFGARTKQFIYYMANQKKSLISLLISDQVRIEQAGTDANLARDMRSV